MQRRFQYTMALMIRAGVRVRLSLSLTRAFPHSLSLSLSISSPFLRPAPPARALSLTRSLSLALSPIPPSLYLCFEFICLSLPGGVACGPVYMRRSIGWLGGDGGVGVREDMCVCARLNWEGPICPSQQQTTALCISVWVCVWVDVCTQLHETHLYTHAHLGTRVAQVWQMVEFSGEYGITWVFGTLVLRYPSIFGLLGVGTLVPLDLQNPGVTHMRRRIHVI